MDSRYFEQEMSQRARKVDDFIANFFEHIHRDLPANDVIGLQVQSMKYSATNGGKRFRPVLSLLIGEILKVSEKEILPFACAVELVHTYSLIHDDLPCMDNDDIRRGQPTNHKVYGEATALLAGDGLLTESFFLISQYYRDNPVGMKLIDLLSTAAGIRGMIGGQAMDLGADKKKWTEKELQLMHQMKTGCMIEVAVTGAATLAGVGEDKFASLKRFGAELGMAFQVADDLLDAHEANQESRSYVSYLGEQGTRDFLKKISQSALGSLHAVVPSAPLLESLIEFNLLRKV